MWTSQRTTLPTRALASEVSEPRQCPGNRGFYYNLHTGLKRANLDKLYTPTEEQSLHFGHRSMYNSSPYLKGLPQVTLVSN